MQLAQALPDSEGEEATLALAPGLGGAAAGALVGLTLCVAKKGTFTLGLGLNEAVGEADAVTQALAGPLAKAEPALALALAAAPGDAPAPELPVAPSATVDELLGEFSTVSDTVGVPVGLAESEGVTDRLALAPPGLKVTVGVPVGLA